LTIEILNTLLEKKQKKQKQLAVLIDPDSVNENQLIELCNLCNQAKVDLILVGGSLITNGFWNKCVTIIKSLTQIPVLLFPGNIMQVHDEADAILFLSMISGRNADLLIGKHVLAAPMLKKSGVEVIPTAYMIVDGGNITSVMYMSNTMPIPHDKNNIAVCTAMAGEMLGLKVMYMDAGSGAKQPISSSMVQEVADCVSAPLFVGGGIRTAEQALLSAQAGADVVVVGNAFEKNPNLILEICSAIHSLNNIKILI
jgi:putative glycerol-1-phosphate prenyltransferase